MDGLKQIGDLCREHTNLSNADIEKVYEASKWLPIIANLAEANVFIDCLTKDEQRAVVVAESTPATGPSLYTDSVVGHFTYENFEPAVIFTLKTGEYSTGQRAVTQEGIFVKQNVVPIKNDHQEVIASVTMEQDISELIGHENRLRALSDTTEQLSQTLIGLTEPDSIISDMIQESLFLLDSDGVIIYANSCAANLIAKMTASGDVVGTKIDKHLPFVKDMNPKEKDVFVTEVTVDHKVFEVKRISLRKFEKLSGILFIIRDLTALREKERELMVKSAVIKEIHHRVKNNLQTVASLLRLQMKHGVPEEVRGYFRESISRILSMSTVHDEMLKNSDLGHVEIHELIKRIVYMLIRNSKYQETDIDVHVERTVVYLNSDQATSLALVVNELIQNCLKHAFNDCKHGEIYVTLREKGNTLQVCVKDNGVGYSPSNKSSLGLEIVTTIVKYNLFGHFTIKRIHKGTKATVEFVKEEVKST